MLLAYGKIVWYLSITSYSLKSNNIMSTGCNYTAEKYGQMVQCL